VNKKPIIFSKHALAYTDRRGFTEAEIVEAIRDSEWEPADSGRMQCRKEFIYEKEWNGKYYAFKQVRPIFIEEEVGISVITVYTYYYQEKRNEDKL
jgi:hypothetical protein